MNVHETTRDGILTLRPTFDRLDDANSEEFRRILLARIESGSRTLVIDFGSVEFVGSSGLGGLVAAVKRLEGRGEILLCGLREPVHELFRVTHLLRVLPAFPDEAAARESRLRRVR
jgi:anti-sigma B factor antagonist